MSSMVVVNNADMASTSAECVLTASINCSAGTLVPRSITLKPLLSSNMLTHVEKHRSEGHVLVLVSGSIRYYLRPVIKDLGFDHLLCTDLEVRNGVLTGRTLGNICVEMEKRTRIEMLADKENLDLFSSHAYGNHQSDIPMLDLVGHAYVVDPTRPLKKLAKNKGWPILNLA